MSLTLRLKGFCLKPSCAYSASKQSHNTSLPSWMAGSAGGSLAATQTPHLPSVPQTMPVRPSEMWVLRPSGGRAVRDVGSIAGGEPISSRSWGRTMVKRLMLRTQRQASSLRGKPKSKTRGGAPASKKKVAKPIPDISKVSLLFFKQTRNLLLISKLN